MFRPLSTDCTRGAALALCGALVIASSAQAGSLGDQLRGYIENWRAQGKNLPAFVMGSARELSGKAVVDKRKDKLPIGKDQIVLLVADNCRTCDQALHDIHGKAPEVEVLNISTSPMARDAYSMVRARGVPTVILERAVMSGWDRKKFFDMRTEEAERREPLRNDQGA